MRKTGFIATPLLAVALVAGTAVAPASGEPAPTKIVYARSTGQYDVPKRNEIFIMDADGSDVTRLTDNDKEDAYPNLSPDGTRIAFSRRSRGQYDLYVMDVDGSNVEKLMAAPNSDEVLPTWSPDGKKLAFTASMAIPGGWQSDIYRIRVDNGRFRRLTYTPKAKEFAPEWSPDGNEIAFTKQNERQHKYGIAAVQPDAEGVRWVVINPLSRSGYTDFNPTWSPDSQWIAFSRDHGDDPYVDIFKVRRDGSDVTAVTTLNELAECPVWGSDGRIIFMHDQGIAVVSADGGEISHLTPTRTERPHWWPDW